MLLSVLVGRVDIGLRPVECSPEGPIDRVGCCLLESHLVHFEFPLIHTSFESSLRNSLSASLGGGGGGVLCDRHTCSLCCDRCGASGVDNEELLGSLESGALGTEGGGGAWYRGGGASLWRGVRAVGVAGQWMAGCWCLSLMWGVIRGRSRSRGSKWTVVGHGRGRGGGRVDLRRRAVVRKREAGGASVWMWLLGAVLSLMAGGALGVWGMRVLMLWGVVDVGGAGALLRGQLAAGGTWERGGRGLIGVACWGLSWGLQHRGVVVVGVLLMKMGVAEGATGGGSVGVAMHAYEALAGMMPSITMLTGEWLGDVFYRRRREAERGGFLRVAEYNVAKGLKGSMVEMADEMELKGIDVMVLVETGLLQRDEGGVCALVKERYQCFCVPATNVTAKVEGGLCIMVDKRRGLAVEQFEQDKKEGRWAKVLLAVGGSHKVRLHAGYGVSGGGLGSRRAHAMGVVQEWCRVLRGGSDVTEHVVWMSDSNFVQDSSLDRRSWRSGGWVRGGSGHDNTEHLYHTFLAETGLHDMWEWRHGDKEGWTRDSWGTDSGIPSGSSRIDHVFMSDSLASACVGVGVWRGGGVVRSDHSMVVAELELREMVGAHRRFELTGEEMRAKKLDLGSMDEDKWGQYEAVLDEWWGQQGKSEWAMERGSLMGAVGGLVGMEACMDWVQGAMEAAAAQVVGYKRVVPKQEGGGGRCAGSESAQALHVMNKVMRQRVQQGRWNKGMRRLARSLDGKEVRVREKLGDRWCSDLVAVKVVGKGDEEVMEYFGGMVPRLLGQVKWQAREGIKEACAKRREALEAEFHSGSKKKWLNRVLGRWSRNMDVRHCWVREGGGVVLSGDMKEVRKSIAGFFYQWTKASTEREDEVMQECEELREVYEERKAEEVWWVPTEDHPEGDRQFLTRPPGDGECEEVLKLMGRGKGTGPSGLPIELLVHAPMEVRQVVWSVVRTAFELGEMPESFKVANVFCLPKTDSPITTPSNIRPVTLLEHMKMQVVTRVLMGRINRVLEEHKGSLLDEMQFAGYKGGSTSDPLFLRQSIAEHYRMTGGEYHVFDSDISKAFDSVHFWSLQQALERLGMPSEAVRMIIKCQGGESRVLVGGGGLQKDIRWRRG